jgi:DNA topoisomerase I
MTDASRTLRHVDDATLPGITRRRRGRYWQYFDCDGNRITDRDEIDRLNGIGLPPAYRDAWFCPHADGHIQAIGYDDKGRKQYRYHPHFRAQQELAKYDLCAEFGRALPKLRKKVEADLRRGTLSRKTVAAAVVRLLDSERIRVGNEAYAKANKSFGATTLRRRHVRAFGRAVKMRFQAKGGVIRELNITDRRLNRIVRKAQDLPGQHLFQYLDDDGDTVPVTSTDVNDYIRAAMGEEFSAKHFRTWGASAIAFERICAARGGRVSLKELLDPVAEALGNTPAISRKSYVHPAIVEAVRNGEDPLRGLPCPRKTKYLSRAERGLIRFLEEQAVQDEPKSKAA